MMLGHRCKTLLTTLCLLFAFGAIGSGPSEGEQQTEEEELTVGVKPAPPFLIEESEGIEKGVAHDLWVKVAENSEWDYRLKRFDTLSHLLDAVEKGRVDLTISPLTVTSDRLKRMDFTQSFYVSNLAIATQKKAKNQVLHFIRNFFSTDFLKSVLLLFLVIMIFGLILWSVERRKNPEMFRKGWPGVMDGFWWSAVTMTTVGYGDKAPKSGWGKFIATIWMFTAVIIVSGFTATIASSLTVQRTQHGIEGLQDLAKIRTITVKGSNSASFLRKKGIDPRAYATLEEAVEALHKNRADALLYDEPLLRYTIHGKEYGDELMILNQKFEEQHYSFALPKGSPYEDQLNRELLKVLESPDWEPLLQRYEL